MTARQITDPATAVKLARAIASDLLWYRRPADTADARALWLSRVTPELAAQAAELYDATVAARFARP